MRECSAEHGPGVGESLFHLKGVCLKSEISGGPEKRKSDNTRTTGRFLFRQHVHKRVRVGHRKVGASRYL
jgi:hypothetical protein